MAELTRDDVVAALGRVDDVTMAEIIASGATRQELVEAHAWVANDEPLVNAGRPRLRAGGSVVWWSSLPPCRRTKSLCWSADSPKARTAGRNSRVCSGTQADPVRFSPAPPLGDCAWAGR